MLSDKKYMTRERSLNGVTVCEGVLEFVVVLVAIIVGRGGTRLFF